MTTHLKKLFEKTNLELPSTKIELLDRYAQLILKWNQTRNLVSRNTSQKEMNEHILDCACIFPFIKKEKILDVGTGAGLPGMVISIIDKSKQMVLLEPNQKKVSFLQHAQAEFELHNVTVIKGRIEDLEHLKEQLIITRAVMEPEKLLSLLPKERTSSLEILMMISEPKELQSEDWEHMFYPSDAQRILQKNRGFLSIKNKKN